MTLDETIDLLTQISIYAGIAAIVLVALTFILTAIVRANRKKQAAGTAASSGDSIAPAHTDTRSPNRHNADNDGSDSSDGGSGD